MFSYSGNRRLLIVAALVVASCSQGDTPGLGGPNAVNAGRDAGGAGSLAVGDVRTGPGTIEIDAVRMDRQNPAGVSVFRQYANPGQEYVMIFGETIELWVEYDRGDNEFPSGVAPNIRRLFVEWGDGVTDFTPCGTCKLTHQYLAPGRYLVKVTLTDGGGTSVTRTFYLNSLEAETGGCVEPDSSSIPEVNSCDGGSFNVSGYFTGTNLAFSLVDECSQSGADQVRALGAVSCNSITISPSGVLSYGDCADDCFSVTATNECGTTSRSMEIVTGCDN